MTTYTDVLTGDIVLPTDVSYAQISIPLSGTSYLVWPGGVTSTASATYTAARIMDIATSAAGQYLRMPPANQASTGQDALIRNITIYTFTVLDNAGNTIGTIASGKATYFYVTDNSTAAGTWASIAFGVGTSTADAASLQGNGVLAIGSTLNQSHPSSTFTTGYTFVSADRAKTKVWVSGAGTATLPLASSVGDNFFFLLKNNGTGTLTISRTGSDLIDGLISKSFQPSDSCFLLSTGTAWVSVGYGRASNYYFTVLTKPVVSGAYSLTSIEAQSVIQQYVGALTGNVTVTYPPIVNLYAVSNTTTNAYSLTLTTGLGYSVVVPQGAQVTYICDGTNFYPANSTSSSSLSLINGTVAVPSLNFISETNTGLYRMSAGHLGLAIGGVNRFDLSATGLSINGGISAGTSGTGTFPGGVSGGTF